MGLCTSKKQKQNQMQESIPSLATQHQTETADQPILEVQSQSRSQGRASPQKSNHPLRPQYLDGFEETFELDEFEQPMAGPIYQLYQHRQSKVKYLTALINKPDQKRQQKLFVLQRLSHPNVALLIDIYYFGHQQLQLVYEAVARRNLLNRPKKLKHLNEQVLKETFAIILRTLNFLQQQHIYHKQLTPECIVFPGHAHQSVKLIGCGISAKIISLRKGVTTQAYLYYPPEKCPQQHNSPNKRQPRKEPHKADIWACGVILYLFLTGIHPFKGDTIVKSQHNISKGVVSFSGIEWENISPQCKDLVEKMLTFNKQHRPNAEQCLSHEWFQMQNHTSPSREARKQEVYQITVMDKLSAFTKVQAFQSATMKFMVQNVTNGQQKTKLMKVFQAMDVDGNGQLSKEELIAGFSKTMSEEEARQEVDRLYRSLCYTPDMSIKYHDFVVAAISKKQLLSQQNLLRAFKTLDTDQSGQLSYSEIKIMLKEIQCDEFEIKRILAEADKDKNGQISFTEFASIMTVLIEKRKPKTEQ